ncbi:MAG: amidohydrolase [Elusimicrobiota bacterium]|jgi:predicted TIM-barrel fold metal-dependent hydrolase|nr:amidohydrolase [Elusimicrobiota bacterium]
MIDTHIHIGQFKDRYYDPLEVLTTVFEAGIKEAFFSSITASDTATFTYSAIEREISEVLSALGTSSDRAKPLLWYVPEYAKQGINIEKAFKNLPYCGFKIHPLENKWDLSDKNTVAIANEIFEYAQQNNLFVLIHTGNSGVDAANKFNDFFRKYSRVKFALAHARPLAQAIDMLSKYPNVCVDTAFLSLESLNEIINAGFASRILLGSDFPVTQYFHHQISKEWRTLKKQYEEDAKQMKLYNEIIKRS